MVLSKLVRKGLLTDDIAFHDALYPIFDRLVKLYPLPKEDEEQHPLLSDFHRFVYTSVSEGLQNATTVRSVLLMLQSIVSVTPERIEGFGTALFKLLGKLSKEHCSAQPPLSASFEQSVKLLISALDICLAGAIHLPAENRRFLTSALTMLVEKSKSQTMCRYLLALGRTWAFQKNEPYPPTKDKATFLQRMATFETRAFRRRALRSGSASDRTAAASGAVSSVAGRTVAQVVGQTRRGEGTGWDGGLETV